MDYLGRPPHTSWDDAFWGAFYEPTAQGKVLPPSPAQPPAAPPLPSYLEHAQAAALAGPGAPGSGFSLTDLPGYQTNMGGH